MKTRSSRMMDLNSSGGLESFAASWWSLPTLLEWEWSGTASSLDFKNVIKDVDPTLFKTLTYAGQGIRKMFDRRIGLYGSSRDVNAYLFNAEYEYEDHRYNQYIEIQVNPEFSQDVASSYAVQYAKLIGKLPIALRLYVNTVWIHDGYKPFGGDINYLLIHVTLGDKYNTDGTLEEILIHEASHTSLDRYKNDRKWKDAWKDAQEKDKKYISTYAAIEDGGREDIAESFVAYFAVTYRKDRISIDTYEKVIKTIPNRIKFFDSLNLDMYPYVKSPLKPS